MYIHITSPKTITSTGTGPVVAGGRFARNSPARGMFVRIFDVGVALLAAIVFLPVCLPIGLAIFLEDGGPIFYRQKRVGRAGSLFEILKFRTMRAGSGGRSITAAGDARTTKVGGVLRKFKLDELPQLICVLRGDMSLIGPRPEVPEYVDLHDQLWRAVLQVRPGITDLASLAYRDEEEQLAMVRDPDAYYRSCILPEKLRLNIEYHRIRTMGRDCKLLWLTARYSFFRYGFDRQRVTKSFQ
jgi:lipopolysaccharide/colanic/teichoic acid biosynthesis glycosyltransferase